MPDLSLLTTVERVVELWMGRGAAQRGDQGRNDKLAAFAEQGAALKIGESAGRVDRGVGSRARREAHRDQENDTGRIAPKDLNGVRELGKDTGLVATVGVRGETHHNGIALLHGAPDRIPNIQSDEVIPVPPDFLAVSKQVIAQLSNGARVLMDIREEDVLLARRPGLRRRSMSWRGRLGSRPSPINAPDR